MPDTVELRVNGTSLRSGAQPSTPLIDVLRNEFNLTGTRFGCGSEACGSCTIIIDGELAYACTRSLDSAVGVSIETVESLSVGRGDDEGPHPLIDAFIELQAGQCGYCLSGILMCAKHLLDNNDTPTRADIINALDRHLCRCGAHTRIIKAVERAAGVIAAKRSNGR